MSSNSGDHIDVEFHCNKCGELITWAADLPDTGIVYCPGCGVEVGPLGDLKKIAMLQAKKKAVDVVRDAFKDTFKRKR